MKLIILDRDGVINYESTAYIKSPEEWIPIPGSLEAIAELNRAGYLVVVATNQSGVARGLYDLTMLNKIHKKLTDELAKLGGSIDEIFFCPHHPEANCECRKPKLGLFKAIQDKYQHDLKDIYYIGDTATDIEVALKVKCKPVLVLTGNGKKTQAHHPEYKNIPQFEDLFSAVQTILGENS